MTLALMFVLASQTYNLPEGLLRAICFTESQHRVSAIHHDDGGANSVGVCQVQLPTARLMGFRGTESQLMDVQTNVMVAARYLSHLRHRYQGDNHKAVSAYNMGSWRLNSKGITANQSYVNKVFKVWKGATNEKHQVQHHGQGLAASSP